jgi:hypothetical protein
MCTVYAIRGLVTGRNCIGQTLGPEIDKGFDIGIPDINWKEKEWTITLIQA